MIVWIDLETTGLEHDGDDTILEVAAIATTDQLDEFGRFHAVTSAARDTTFNSLNVHVQDMHLGNGLWLESLRSDLSVKLVRHDLAGWIAKMRGIAASNGDTAKPILGGSGVHFDRAFLRRHMREAHDQLHYRNLDVTAFFETARRFWPDLVDKWPSADGRHRAMGDIEASISVYRYFLASIEEWQIAYAVRDAPPPYFCRVGAHIVRADAPAEPDGPPSVVLITEKV